MLCSIRHSFYHIENQKPMLSNGKKKTLFKAPKELINILTDWKIEQKSN